VLNQNNEKNVKDQDIFLATRLKPAAPPKPGSVIKNISIAFRGGEHAPEALERLGT